MRSKQPDRVIPNNPPRRLYQDIPTEAAKIQARMAGRTKKAGADVAPETPTPEKSKG